MPGSVLVCDVRIMQWFYRQLSTVHAFLCQVQMSGRSCQRVADGRLLELGELIGVS